MAAISSTALRTTVDFAKEQPHLYYGGGLGYVILSPIVGIARIVHACLQWGQIPSQAKVDAVTDPDQKKHLDRIVGYKSIDKMEEFWKGQILRGILEIALPFIAAIAFAWRDVVWTRPEPTFTSHPNPFNIKFDTNLAGYDEVTEGREWNKQVNKILSSQKPAVDSKLKTEETPPTVIEIPVMDVPPSGNK